MKLSVNAGTPNRKDFTHQELMPQIDVLLDQLIQES